jgi:EAL domain-containing protein (putative c-di-GMP-specific phosphodiesterase class I)
LFPEDGDDIETLLQNADTARYHVKAGGRNSWLFYTGQMNVMVSERLRLENDMRAAMQSGGFTLHFQPQFDMGSRRIVAWEALLRWLHPEFGWLPPEKFIPVAEETGLIVPLGAWVLEESCRAARQWEAAGLGNYRVCVNLSGRQFDEPGLVETVGRALAAAGLDAARLELEITESMLMGKHAPILDTLNRLKALGVYLTLDDFGTGYSSLAYLKSFAVDRLKIARSFIQDLHDDPNDAAIVQAVISPARALNIGVIAEGVETRDQQTILTARGCGETQGFLTGRPMPADQIPAFIAGGFPAGIFAP